METGRGGATAGRRWLACGLVLLAASVITVAAGVALAMGWLTVTAAVLLASCAVGMAALSMLLYGRAERQLRHEFTVLLQAAQASERQAQARRAMLCRMADSLQQAGTPNELAQRLLSGLAPALTVHQGLCCYWDEERQQLRAAARYGGEGADAGDALAGQTLLAPLLLEAARSRREIVIASPGASYLRVNSGLGDAEPAELLVLPLEYRGRLLALLELAALQPVGDAARVLLQEILPVFALCLAVLKRADGEHDRPAQAGGDGTSSRGPA